MLLVPAIVCVLAALTTSTTAVREMYPHVRMPQPHVAHLVADAARRSPTFASMLRRLQDSDIVAFVGTTTLLEPRMVGRTVLVNGAGLVRYLQIDVRADSSEHEVIVTIAHELQHAIEIAESGVRDQRAMAQLFEAIGERHARGFESNDARAAGARVGWELTHPSRLIAEDAAPLETLGVGITPAH